jgi:hypothetical protein
MIKEAYLEGVQNALSDIGLAPKQERAGWRSLIAPALGVGGAAALYPLLRRVRLSKIPGLRQLQQASRGHVTTLAEAADNQLQQHWLGRLLGPKRTTALMRGADDVVMMDAATAPRKVQGAVFSSVPSDIDRGQIKGTLDLGLRQSNKLPEQWTDKLYEGEQMARYMPGVGPKTQLPPSYLADMPTEAALQDLQQQMRQSNQILKPRNAAATGNVILPTDDLAALYAEKSQRGDWLREALRRPEDYILQEKLPIKYERRLPGKRFAKLHPGRSEVPMEYRVHVVNGVIVPGAIVPRTPGRSSINPFHQRRVRREIVQQLQSHVQNLPREITHNQILPLDVVATPQGGYRIVELNAGPGGISGFLTPEETGAFNTAPHAIYKAITGRHSKPMAAAKALLGGGALAGAGAAGNAIAGD